MWPNPTHGDHDVEKNLELTLPVAAFTQVLSFLAQEFFKEDFFTYPYHLPYVKIGHNHPPPLSVYVQTISPSIMMGTNLNIHYLRTLSFKVKIFWPNRFREDF